MVVRNGAAKYGLGGASRGADTRGDDDMQPAKMAAVVRITPIEANRRARQLVVGVAGRNAASGIGGFPIGEWERVCRVDRG